MSKISKYLNQHIVGNVFDDSQVLEAYSTDRSVLKIQPRMVALPSNTQDIKRILKFVDQLAKKDIFLPVTVRGSGLDKTGADLGSGMILSMERLNHIKEIDDHARVVRVQAGTTLGQLNAALSLVGMYLPIKADEHETIGSLIANFITDDLAGKYSGIYYYVDCIEVVLANGECISTRRVNRRGLKHLQAQTDFSGMIYKKMADVIERHFDVIDELNSQDTIDPAGYQMISQVYQERGKSFDLLPLFYGSQGTLGVISEVLLRCEPLPARNLHFVAAFESISPALDFAEAVDSLHPSEINLYDARIFHEVEEFGKNPALFADKFKDGYVVLVAFNDKKAAKKIKKSLKILPDNAAAIIEGKDNIEDFARFKTAVSSYLNDTPKGERVFLIDDFYLPAESMTAFLTDLKVLEKRHHLKLPLFGSYAANNYKIYPDLNLGTVIGRQTVMRLLKDFHALLTEYDGSITGGAAEGRTKAITTNPNIAEPAAELYEEIRQIFDPENVLNPEVKTGAEVKNVVRHLRTSEAPGLLDVV